jgi:hypothetical protein
MAFLRVLRHGLEAAADNGLSVAVSAVASGGFSAVTTSPDRRTRVGHGTCTTDQQRSTTIGDVQMAGAKVPFRRWLLVLVFLARPVLGCSEYWDSQGFGVASYSYAITQTTVQAAISGVAYGSAGARDSYCASRGYLGSGYMFMTRPAHLEVWVFEEPYRVGDSGYQLYVSPSLALSMSLQPTPPAMQPAYFVPSGGSFSSPSTASLVSLPAGTWWPTVFLFDEKFGGAMWYSNGSKPTVIAGNPPPPPPPPSGNTVSPQVGLWWNPNESGSGYALDFKHGVLVITIYSYKANGDSQWYIASGPLSGNVFTSSLEKYAGGQCIACGYGGRPAAAGNDGTISITFTSSTSATVHLPGGRTTQIEPQSF